MTDNPATSDVGHDVATTEDRALSRKERMADRVGRARVRGQSEVARYERLADRRPVFGLPLAFMARYVGRQGPLLASAVAFRLFLWLLPLALLTAGILAAVSRTDSDSIESASKKAGATGAVSQQVVSSVQSGQTSWWIAVLFGAVLLVWTTRTLIRNLVVVNAHSWQAPLPKARQKDVLWTMTMFLGLWIAAFALDAGVHEIEHLVTAGVIVAVLLQSVILGGAWLVICLRLPDRRAAWTDLIPGAAIFGVGMALLNVMSRVYLPRKLAHSSALYGSLGVAAVILAWMLLIGELVVGSALANSVWSDYRAYRRGESPPPPTTVSLGDWGPGSDGP